jgi:TPR repeat protein
MKATLPFLLLATTLFAAVSAYAGHFETGEEAYQKGDYTTAFQEYKTAAENGDPRAQGKLAALYLYGRGTSVDYGKAYLWFEMAARQGDEFAARFRDAAAARLTVEELQRLNDQLGEYARKYVDPYKEENKPKEGAN